MASHRTDITEADVRDWCCKYLARVLRLAPERIDPQAEFSSIGLDSAESVFMVSALEDWSGLELSSDTAMEHPSAVRLAKFVADRLTKG